MSKRDILAFLLGAGITLAGVPIGLYSHHGLIGTAEAQQAASDEPLRQLILAIADALASVAVDSERTAVAHNATSDRVAGLAERLGNLEKRLTELEKKR